MLKRTFVLAMILLLATSMLIGCGGGKKKGAEEIKLLNVSYDPTREFYREYNEFFINYWQKKTGKTIIIEQSHGGSGKQARSVIDGLEADVVTLATAADIDAISRVGNLLSPEWQNLLPHNSSPYYSTMIFIVRKGNPKGIHDWGDLVREDVEVITPNPKTSGAARWNYLAAYAWAEEQFDGDKNKIQQWMVELYRHVPILDSGARGASNTFTQSGIGDVLINWENEGFLLLGDVGNGDYEIVVPSISILAEPPVAVVKTNTERHGTGEVALAYLTHLYLPAVQEIVAKHHYRPRNEDVALKYIDKYPKVDLVDISHFGGWPKAQKEHFEDGGLFDEIIRKAQEKLK